MLGYRQIDGRLQVVPGEAKIVKQIFEDYLSGKGFLAIAKKLNVAGVSTQHGGLWRKDTIRQILTCEKYLGEMLLQKTFRKDHISKKKCINQGELPMTHVKGSHEAIISHAVFEQVKAEMARRAQRFFPKEVTPVTYPFTGRLICEKCGKSYRRKHNNAGTKYEKVVWICSTFNTHGKAVCDAQQIPESILEAKAAEILGLSEFDENVFTMQIKEIRVPSAGRLVFIFHDGFQMETEWQNPSRRESWTPEMKQSAREITMKRNEKRRCE
ncbi:MAG: recombinase family protein [Oscillospiraceae bacterium]|jgi:hypothetical protein|nr:recombinase family protein [Oscillospiraceae bacterium]